MYTKAVMWVDVTPTNGQTVNVPVSDSGTTVNLRLNNPALLAALTLLFPVTGVQDGQIVKIIAKSAITLLTMNVETSGSIWGALGGLLGNASGIYQYAADTKTWYKF